MSHSNYFFSKYNNNFDLSVMACGAVGGKFIVNNLSCGYHGLLKQYWEKYNCGKDVLLISENNNVKNEFLLVYPEWNIQTIDLYPEISTVNNVDIYGDICNKINPITNKYDLIINQATLEHVWNPNNAMNNLLDSLKKSGILVTHTHPPGMPYHQYPRDYFRFMIDWWIDLPNHIENVELLELYMYNNEHVFSCYRKI